MPQQYFRFLQRGQLHEELVPIGVPTLQEKSSISRSAHWPSGPTVIMNNPGTVTTEWLKSQLDSGNQKLRVLDVTWKSSEDSEKNFLKEHIPTANYFNIMHEAVHNKMFPRNLPEPASFQKYVRSYGINSDSHVVVYDSEGKGGFFLGGRAWWMFKLYGHDRVSVLNGGLQRWVTDGNPTTSELKTYPEGNFTVKLNTSMRMTYEDMEENLSSKRLQVCDSRARAVYQAESDPKGHYPEAKNIPFAEQLLDPNTNTMKSPLQLQEVFSAAGVDLQLPLVTMCNSGMSSSTLCLAAYMCGNKQPAVYHGGMTEWSSRAPREFVIKETEQAGPAGDGIRK